MAYLGQTFNQDELPEGQGFDPIPTGWYTATISEAELRDTKAGNGKLINLRFDVVGPTYQGRIVFDMINIQNQSHKAEEIGRAQLGQLIRAIGLPSVQDTEQLIGGTCQIKVAIDKGTKDYPDPKNVVKGYKAAEGSSMPKNSSTQKPQQEPAVAGAKPPWAR